MRRRGRRGRAKAKINHVASGMADPTGQHIRGFLQPSTARKSSEPDRVASDRCIRLMATGKCPKENCKNSHVKPTSLGQANLDKITTRLAEIYGR
jgi:hypothetical protein